MRYILDGNDVFREFDLQTSTQLQRVLEYFCPRFRVFTDFTEIVIGVNQNTEIVFTWQKFSTENAEYVFTSENVNPFIISVNGQNIEIPVGESLIFSSDTEGEYIIKTVNNLVGNTEVKVVVSHG